MHTYTEKGTASLLHLLLAGSGTEEARTGRDNCCPGQRYLFFLLSKKNWYNCTAPFSGWLLHNRRRFSITYLKLKPPSLLPPSLPPLPSLPSPPLPSPPSKHPQPHSPPPPRPLPVVWWTVTGQERNSKCW